MKPLLLLLVISRLAGITAGLLAQSPSNQKETTEELITATTIDSLPLSGLLVTPVRTKTNKTVVVWIHGAGQNFYYPSYVRIAREMAKKGYGFATVNTRMHDIGSFLSYSNEVALRGGTYWGLASKVPLDIGAWLDELTKRGYERVVLVGHSAGGSSVREYQALTQDKRVVGLVMASVALGAGPPPSDPTILAVATKMVGEGRGQDLLPMLRLSAATYLDYATYSEDFRDFYGDSSKTIAPLISRIRCPMLAWFGSQGDVGDAKSLDKLKQLIKTRQAGPLQVTTAIIVGASHLYDGSEQRISDVLGRWLAVIETK